MKFFSRDHREPGEDKTGFTSSLSFADETVGLYRIGGTDRDRVIYQSRGGESVSVVATRVGGRGRPNQTISRRRGLVLIGRRRGREQE